MPPARLPYLNHERTRHGRMIWVVRVGKGPRTRMRAPYGSPEFLAAYHAAISSPAAVKPRKPGEGIFAWLWELYRASPAWAELSPATKKQRENFMRLALERAGDQPLERWDRKCPLSSGPITFVLVIAKGRPPRFHRDRRPRLGEELL